SLRDRRDRQRKLALQTPRLTPAKIPRPGPHPLGLAPVGKQVPPALRCVRLVAVTPLRAGPSCSLPGQALNPKQRGHDWTPIQGQTWTPIDTRQAPAAL